MYKRNKILGFITLTVSIIWTFINAHFYYDYNFTATLSLVMIPNWVLVLNIIFGILGSIVGLGILKQKIRAVISTIFVLIVYLLLWALVMYQTC